MVELLPPSSRIVRPNRLWMTSDTCTPIWAPTGPHGTHSSTSTSGAPTNALNPSPKPPAPLRPQNTCSPHGRKGQLAPHLAAAGEGHQVQAGVVDHVLAHGAAGAHNHRADSACDDHRAPANTGGTTTATFTRERCSYHGCSTLAPVPRVTPAGVTPSPHPRHTDHTHTDRGKTRRRSSPPPLSPHPPCNLPTALGVPDTNNCAHTQPLRVAIPPPGAEWGTRHTQCPAPASTHSRPHAIPQSTPPGGGGAHPGGRCAPAPPPRSSGWRWWSGT
jgi:hypothetical protein